MITELLPEIGIRFKYSCEKIIATKIKEIACYVPLDYDKEGKNIKPYDYELPDGNHIILDEQRIKCPEVLFNPSIINREEKGIPQYCYECIQKSDIFSRKDLYRSIVLSGGTTLFNGFPERLNKEIKKLIP